MSEHSDRSPTRKPREDMVKEKSKKLLQSVTYQTQMEKGNAAGTGILMNSYSTLSQLANRFQLKVNIIPTLFGSFDARPIYLRTDPITERVVAAPLPVDQVGSFIDMCFEYNVQRADVINQFKSKNMKGPMVPLMVTKTQNDPNENQVQLDFFSNSASERFNRTFGKSYMVFQRYVPCKGANANVIRCIWSKDHLQKRVYRIQNNLRMSGYMETAEDEMSPTKGGNWVN